MSRVLIATDGSDVAIGAARTGLSLLAPAETVTVLSVVDVRAEMAVGGGGMLGAEPLAMSMADPATTVELDDAMTQEAKAAVQRTIGALGDITGQPDLEALVTHGDPATEICRVAEENGYDVIVVGSHGSGVVKRMLVGSVSHHVLHHAACPVLVVRERNEDDD